MFTFTETAWFSFFLGTAAKSCIVLMCAWLAVLALRGRSAAARHMVWTAAAVALIALPAFTLALPAMRIAAPLPAPMSALFEADATASVKPAPVAQHETPDVLIPARAVPTRPLGLPMLDWRMWTMAAWLAGSTLVLLQMAGAWAAMARLCRGARRPVPSDLAAAVGCRRPVEIVEAAAGTMPMAFGVLHPAILMPADSSVWSEERRRVVLLHELAHVRRGDVPMHLLARTALAFYWWNPLAWMAWREFLRERERAADDLVLSAGERASDYASHLLDVARSMHTSPTVAWAAVGMARPSQLEGRLLAILDGRRNRRAAGRASLALAVAVAIVFVAPFAAVRAQDPQAPLPPDVDATIRAAMTQKNHEILENAASAFEKLRQFDTAEKLLESAAAIRGEVSGQQSLEYGQGLMKLAKLEENRQRPESAQSFYNRAAAAIGERPEAASAHIHLGIIALTQHQFDAARAEFQHAGSLDPSAVGQAEMWLGVLSEREKKQDEAELHYRTSVQVQDPGSHDAGTSMRLLSALFKAEGRDDESNEMMERAKTAQRNSTNRASKGPAVAGVYKVGGDIAAPRLLSKVEPQYTEEARAAKYQGTVLLSIVVGTDGLAHDAQVLQSLGLGLDQNAIDAVTQWKFQPGTKGGQPVPVMATIEVNFRLL